MPGRHGRLSFTECSGCMHTLVDNKQKIQFGTLLKLTKTETHRFCFWYYRSPINLRQNLRPFNGYSTGFGSLQQFQSSMFMFFFTRLLVIKSIIIHYVPAFDRTRYLLTQWCKENHFQLFIVSPSSSTSRTAVGDTQFLCLIAMDIL